MRRRFLIGGIRSKKDLTTDSEFAQKLDVKMKQENWNAKKTAYALGISLASLYNYRNKSDLPSYEILKRTHDRWGWNFKHIDFAEHSVRAPLDEEQARQYVLPFIEGVRESDIRVIRAKPVKPDFLELTVQIKFVS